MKKLQHKHLYGNCVMLSPEGLTLCLCDQKKINWYLSRNLATLEKEDPPTIRLKFIPKGNGKADLPYYLAEKRNICVCCAKSKNLTKHHCVPKCFRRFFPREYKTHNCHDIVLLCDACHIKYEVFAQELKQQLIDEHRITKYMKNEEHHALRSAANAANALLRYGDVIPSPRWQELEQRVKDYLQKDVVTNDDFLKLCENDLSINRLISEGDRFGAKIVGKLDNIPDFIVMWRKHFIDTMNPQFLPKFWSVDHDDLVRNWGVDTQQIL
jgi:hypothetical protein